MDREGTSELKQPLLVGNCGDWNPDEALYATSLSDVLFFHHFFYLKHVLLQVQSALGFQNLSIELSGSERKFTLPVQNNQVDTGTTSLLQFNFFDQFYPGL